jgi:hypothetical protein
MKWYVLTLFLLVGFVWSASAQQVDSGLVGDWETTDGPCHPCVLSIQGNGGVKFDLSGTALEVIGAQITADPGVNVTLPLGGKLELALTKSSTYLVGYYTDPNQSRSNQPVAFRDK